MTTTSLRSTIAGSGTLYTLAMAFVAAVAAWPIYASVSYVILAVSAVIAGFAIAAFARLWRWPAWLVAVVAAAAIVCLGLAIAVPVRGGDPGSVLAAVREIALGAVTGWKDLITVDLPVGGYRNLLVPALVVFLVGTLMTALLSSREHRFGSFSVVPALAMVSFGLVFGRPVTSDPLRIGALVVPAPVETLVGAAALVFSLLWLAWRARQQRRSALRRAADASGVRISRRRTGSDTRRGVLAGVMVAVAVVGGAAVAPAFAAGQSRDVLRSGAGPDLAIRSAVSPLSQYRANFSPTAVDSVLFQVDPAGGVLPDRIRLATLSAYDGAVYRVADPASAAAASAFIRVPSRLAGSDGPTTTARIRIEDLRGIWMPTFGSLQQVSFSGSDAASLVDQFYYNVTARAGVDTARGGLRNGDTYTVTATVADQPSLAQLASPGAKPQIEIPDSIKSWIEQQDAGSGGAALATLIGDLRARGYLSHGLIAPVDGAASWMRTLGDGYTFEPSASGHSLARIDTMFRELSQRQRDAAAEGAGASLVGTVGDDEQFAVAASLIAGQLGFPSRIVVGTRLSGPDEGVAPCIDGKCTGANVTAWLEVRSQNGQWVAADVTPQHLAGLDTAVTRERDPENATDVLPDSAQEVVPPDPVQQDADNDPADPAAGADLAGLWLTLRITGMGALILALLLGPLAVVVLAKALRRRARRTASTPADRIVGGWDEYVDAAVDHGLGAPLTDTRSELAEAYATPGGATLAVAADRAVFASHAPAQADSDEFWRIVADERARFRSGRSWWRRALAAVSLSSFTRGLAPGFTRGPAGAARRIERRGRRPGAR